MQRAAGALEASSSTSASLFPRIMRRKRRAETDDDSCNDHANGQVSDRKISRVDAVSSTMDETESVSISHFSDDVLLRIFRFFVYSLGTIDGISLKSSMLVCRRWNKAVSYPALWKIPAGLSLRCSSDTNDNDSSSGNPRTISRSTIQSSLQIQDISCGKDLSDSLLGFVNLGKNSESKEFITYNARERATNRHCTLKISKTTTRNKEMLREIFWTHFLQGDNNRFYALDHPRNTKKRRPEFNLAKGVHMVSGRVICGYQDRQPALKQYISLSLKEPCPSLLGCFLYQNERQRWDPKDIMSCLRNLEGHPLASLPENLQQKTITPFRRDRWAKLVDWVVEIVECFDLEDNLAFRAFMYLDHFASTSNVSVKGDSIWRPCYARSCIIM